MGEEDTIWGVWREAAALIVRYPLATLAPAVVLGAIGEVPGYLMERRPITELGITLATAYAAYYLYLAYAEGIVKGDQLGTQRRGLGGLLDDLREAVPFVPGVLVASFIVSFSTALGTLLLIIPGLWICTRWALTTPVIREEGIGPIAAVRVSSRLVKGHFWFVLATATAAFYLEGSLIHLVAQGAGWITGSYTWGEWAGGSIGATLIMPLAAFATSLAHSSVAKQS